MLTIIGKATVFFIVMVSVAGLGIAIWLAIDYRDWQGDLAKVKAEIDARNEARQREEAALRGLLTEIASGSRKMSYDVESKLGDGKPGASMSVRQVKEEIKALEQENLQKLNEANQLQGELNTAIDLVAKARAETEAALKEQEYLRELIKPDPDKDPDRKPIRDIIAEHRAARDLAESQRERTKPDAVNELMRLAQVLKRNAELRKRVEQLKGGAEATSRP